ncbi:MAG: HK97 family phage prohead protease [Chromatiaceae bacterium]|nr:HK97 family phage prohead protease [Chromatiaceae bacterium]
MLDDFTPAAKRAAGLRSITQRPSERRSAPDGGRGVVRAPLSSPLQVREAGESGLLTFVGVASVTERAYPMWDMFGEYSEVIDAAAFDDTLARNDLDVTLVLGHDQMRRIARTTLGTLRLAAGEDGLAVDADLDPADPDVAYAAPKLRSGLYDEMSFAFRIESGQWSPDYTEYRITRVDLHRGDVSIVGWGANPYTTGGLRSVQRATFAQHQAAHLDLAIATG